MSNPSWEQVKKFYKENFGMDAWAVEIIANLDILVLCVSGASNRAISTFTDIDVEEVEKVISQTFGFGGWSLELPVNPYKLYTEMSQLDESVPPSDFIKELRLLLAPFVNIQGIDYFFIFTMCQTMSEIESRIYDEWI